MEVKADKSSRVKTLKKVLAWRCISISVTVFVLYTATGDVKSASNLTLLLHAILIACHYVFEKTWESKDETW